MPDLDAGDTETRVAATEQEILVAVQEFLGEFVSLAGETRSSLPARTQ